jgi:hypothetical protein
VYLHELQRDCLFVCRVNLKKALDQGLLMNPCNPYAVNRAAHYKGGCYVQIFTPAASIGDGGLSEAVPDELKRCFPEKVKDGFFWLNVYDFHNVFGTIFECRLTNSPDVGLPDMPPPRLPNAWPPGPQPLYFESIFANNGQVSRQNNPEFTISLPGRHCEVVAAVEQIDHRMTQVGLERVGYNAILLKVYQHLQGNKYSANLVCRSNWMPIRNAMVSFKSDVGGTFKIVAELPADCPPCDKLIFRCYVTTIGTQVTANPALTTHYLVRTGIPPSALKWSFVGCEPAWRMEAFGKSMPYPLDCLDEDLDDLLNRTSGESVPLITAEEMEKFQLMFQKVFRDYSDVVTGILPGQNGSRQTLPNGDVYEGDLVNGLRHGKGTMRYAKGGSYEGDWKKNQKHGRGKETFADGAFYEGEFQEGVRHGEGVYISVDGRVYEYDKDGKGQVANAQGEIIYEGVMP